MCKISLSFRFRISLSDMTNYKLAFGKVCRIKNRHTFKSLPICNSSYHDLVWYAELRIGILLKVCRFVIRHITQTDTETETELLRRHQKIKSTAYKKDGNVDGMCKQGLTVNLALIG